LYFPSVSFHLIAVIISVIYIPCGVVLNVAPFIYHCLTFKAVRMHEMFPCSGVGVRAVWRHSENVMPRTRLLKLCPSNPRRCVLAMRCRKPLEIGFSGLEVSMLASGTQVRGFKPGWSRRIFRETKILSMPSFGGEVMPSVPCRSFAACKRSVHLPWKSHLYAKLNRPFPCPYFPPSLAEVSHVVGRGAPLEMTGGNKSSGAHRPASRSASGLQSPGSAPHKEEEEASGRLSFSSLSTRKLWKRWRNSLRSSPIRHACNVGLIPKDGENCRQWVSTFVLVLYSYLQVPGNRVEFQTEYFGSFWHGYVLHQGTASQGRALCKSQMTSRVLRHTAAAMRAHNMLQGTVEQLRWTVAVFVVYVLRCCT
jgi:hypothetical protein